MNLTTLDAAAAAHAQHGAMAGADPLVDTLYAQLEAPAAEGALPAGTVSAALTAAQLAALAESGDDPWLDVLLPLGVALGAVASHVWRWGWTLPPL